MRDNRVMDGTKMLWHMDAVIRHFDKGERVPPIHIDVGIAKFCNVACTFCYGRYQNIKPVFIQREPLLQLVKDAHAMGIKSLAFIGDGEPTCNPYLYDALLLSQETDVDMALSTNGALIDTEEKCKTILESCVWMRYCLSAGTREGYKQIHGKDYFDKVVSNVRLMMATKRGIGSKCDVGLQAVFVPTVMKEEMLAESKLAVELGVDYFVIKQCSLPDSGESGMSQFDVNDYDKQDVNDTLKECEALSTDKTKIIVKWNIIKQKGEKPYDGCPSIPFISEISGNGDWYPCGYFFGEKEQFLKYKFGNLHEKSIKEIFEGDDYWRIIEELKALDVHKVCRGACRQDNTNKFCYEYLNRPRGINFI